MVKMILYALLIGALSSCSIVKTTPRTLEIPNAEINVAPMVAEIDVLLDKKITASSSGPKAALDRVKENACWKAIIESSSDMIVAPNFNIVTSGVNVMVTVNGFSGVFKQINSLDNAALLEYLLLIINTNGGISALNLVQFKKLYALKFEKSNLLLEDKLSEKEVETIYYNLLNTAKTNTEQVDYNQNYRDNSINSELAKDSKALSEKKVKRKRVAKRALFTYLGVSVLGGLILVLLR